MIYAPGVWQLVEVVEMEMRGTGKIDGPAYSSSFLAPGDY